MTDSNPPDDDPFAEFESWLIRGSANWPSLMPIKEFEQLAEQQAIVRENARLLINRREWHLKVQRFEAALLSLGDENSIQSKRAEYAIALLGYEFENVEMDFSEYHFPCDVWFSHVVFGDGGVDFYNAHFLGGATFDEVVFGVGDVRFDRAKLSGNGANFHKSEFLEGNLSFWGVNFGNSVNFSESIFKKNFINFHGANFGDGSVIFSSSDVRDSSINISRNHIRGNLDFRGAAIEYASFVATEVDGFADFSGSSFGKIPDFRQMFANQLSDVAGMDVPVPQLSIGFPFSIASNDKDAARLRKLKAMAIAANDHEKDGEFFAYEMMAKRGVEHTTFWQLLFNTIYWKVSFYGQSYLCPLGWLSASFATFATIYSLMATPPLAGWNSLFLGITYSFKNSLPFLGTLTRSVPSPEGHVSWFAQQLSLLKDAQVGPDWFTALGTGQAMLSLFFFFFLLLGLRNKFRLR